jgi:hypothetical protein
MPSLDVADVPASVFGLAGQRRRDETCEGFEQVLPFIVFSVKDVKAPHHSEKSLLMVRGMTNNTVARDESLELDPYDRHHIRFLNNKILTVLRWLGLPRNPVVSSLALAEWRGRCSRSFLFEEALGKTENGSKAFQRDWTFGIAKRRVKACRDLLGNVNLL